MSKLYFSYAAMNAGKSTILLQSSHNYIERGMRTLLLKPAIDNREAGSDRIRSRIGLTAASDSFTPATNLQDYILDAHEDAALDCVFIDEAQFLTKDQVWQLTEVSDHHKLPVMCFGLRTDFQGHLFEGSAALLAIADELRELKTLCWCGRKATMNLRLAADGHVVSEGAQIEIGGNDRYVSLCRKHWKAKVCSKPEGYT